jgi:hypothetical protein
MLGLRAAALVCESQRPECVSECLKRNCGVFVCISALISLDLPSESLRKIAL